MAHNDVNGKKHPTNYKHIAYEQGFQNRLKAFELDEVREKIANSFYEELKRINNTSLKNYIMYKHNKYMKEIGKSYLYNSSNKKRNIDINYSLGMPMIIASYIIDTILS